MTNKHVHAGFVQLILIVMRTIYIDWMQVWL